MSSSEDGGEAKGEGEAESLPLKRTQQTAPLRYREKKKSPSSLKNTWVYGKIYLISQSMCQKGREPWETSPRAKELECAFSLPGPPTPTWTTAGTSALKTPSTYLDNSTSYSRCFFRSTPSKPTRLGTSCPRYLHIPTHSRPMQTLLSLSVPQPLVLLQTHPPTCL